MHVKVESRRGKEDVKDPIKAAMVPRYREDAATNTNVQVSQSFGDSASPLIRLIR